MTPDPHPVPRRRLRVLLLLVPAVLTALGVLAAIVAVSSVRDDARREGSLAAIAQANATQVRQGAVMVQALGILIEGRAVKSPAAMQRSLAMLQASGAAQHRALVDLVGDRPEGRRALRTAGRARGAALTMITPPVTRAKLARAAMALDEAARALDEVSARARANERDADRRADRAAMLVLTGAGIVITGSWWGFFLLARRMQRRHVDELRHLADHDPLTGLGNRRALAVTARDLPAGAVLAICDLDGFKPFNDRFGHPAGDDLLIRLAARLDALAAAHGGRAFRVGGDELCVLIPGAGPPGLGGLCEQALHERGGDYELGASAGVARIAPGAAGLDEAWRAADARLYEVKRARYRDDPDADRRHAAPGVRPAPIGGAGASAPEN